MGEFKKSTTAVNRLFASVTDVDRYATKSYRVAEFSWEGGRYRLSSTGDLYQLNYCGVPVLLSTYLTMYRDKAYATVGISKQLAGYYIRGRKQFRMKDLIWAAFGDRDLPRNFTVECRDGNPANCKIENLEAKKRGVS